VFLEKMKNVFWVMKFLGWGVPSGGNSALPDLVGRTTKSLLVGNHHHRILGEKHLRPQLGQSLVLTQASFQSPTSYQRVLIHHGTQATLAFVATTKPHLLVVS
jgi:hypothetical protein